MHSREGEFEEAGRLAHRAVCLCEETVGPESPSLASPLIEMGGVVFDAGGPGHLEEAEQLFRRSLQLLESDLARDAQTYAEALWSVGFCCFLRGLFAEAEERAEAALDVY